MSALPEAAAALFELAPGDFTRERNALAARLRKEGRGEEADAVRALRKPTLAVWAANRLARKRRKEVRELLRAADAVRKAHERGPDALHKATQAERDSVAGLVRAGRELLEEAGQRASDAALDRLADTLRAAALDPDARPLLEAGRLTEEVEAPGFGALAGLQLPAASRRPKGKAKPEGAKRRRDEQKLRALREEARAAEREAAQAERAAQDARRRAERAAKKLAEAEARG